MHTVGTRTADAETLWDLQFSLSCARLGNQACSHEGHGELNICKMIKQLAQRPRGGSLVVATQSAFSNLLALERSTVIFHDCQ